MVVARIVFDQNAHRRAEHRRAPAEAQLPVVLIAGRGGAGGRGRMHEARRRG